MNFLRLKRKSTPPNRQAGEDIIFTDTDGVLKKIDPEGNISEVGGDGASFIGMGQMEGDLESLNLLVAQPFNVDENDVITDGDGALDVTTLYYLLTP